MSEAARYPPPQSLLLDLDGTLVDTLGFLFEAFRHALEPFVARLPTDEDIVATFGPAEPECLARYLRRAESEGFARSQTEAALPEATRRFFSYYESGCDQVRAFPGMVELVRAFGAGGRPVGVFTGKGRRGAEYTLSQLGLWPRGIRCLVSSDDVAFAKPHPEGVLQALEQMGAAKETLLFVGDAPADIQAGNAAGVQTAAALWGSFDKAATLAARPSYACRSASDLRRIVIAEPRP